MKNGKRSQTRDARALNIVRLPSRALQIADGAKRPGISDPALARKENERIHEEPVVGMFSLDRQGRVRELNETGAALLGFPVAWLIGKVFVVFVARQDVQRFLDTLRDLRRTHRPRTVTLELFTGNRTVPVRLSVSASADATITHRLTVAPLSDGEDNGNLLLETMSSWHSLLHNAPDTILTIDTDGRIAFINRPLWGYSVSTLVGTNILDYVPHKEHPTILQCLKQAFRFYRGSTCDLTGFNEDNGRWFNFSFGTPQGSSTPEKRKKKQKNIATLVIREISEHKRTEQNLRESGEQLRDFAAHVEAVREEERARVAREIHDELGQALTALKLDLAWAEKKTGRASGLKKKMQSMITDVDKTIERVRRISSELRPAILDDLGLLPAIEWQLTQFRKRTKVRAILHCAEDSINFPLEVAAAVFRVVQEALTNVMRHAKASKVTVSIHRTIVGFQFTIADNGQGMTVPSQNGVTSLGIVGMKERISRLGGDFHLFSEPGKGTRVEFAIPETP